MNLSEWQSYEESKLRLLQPFAFLGTLRGDSNRNRVA